MRKAAFAVVLLLAPMQRLTPAIAAQSQALKLYQAIQKQDWKAMFYLTKFSEVGAKGVGTDSDLFAKETKKTIDDDPLARKNLDTLLGGLSNLAVGTPIIKGNRADVPASATLTTAGKKIQYQGVVHLIDDKGVWKWDLAGTDDVGAAINKGLTEMLGKPTK
jgi:hypothetical protein